MFNRVQEFRKSDKLVAKHVPNLVLLVNLGHLTLWDFLMFEHEYAQRQGIPIALTEAILQRVGENWLLAKPAFPGRTTHDLNLVLAMTLALPSRSG